MPRINIYISDELQAELDAVKDGLNVSKVCSNAIQTTLTDRKQPKPHEFTVTAHIPDTASIVDIRDYIDEAVNNWWRCTTEDDDPLHGLRHCEVDL